MKDFSLEDVEKSAKMNQKEFFIPSEEKRKGRKVGDLVRLHFLLNEKGSDLPRAERMWVEIVEKDREGTKFKGILTNAPRYLKSISPGDTVNFEAKHIAQIIISKDDPLYVECGEMGALVSARVFEKDGMVRFLYKEKGDREEDSGWRLFNGGEDDEYSNKSKNIRIVNVGWLLDYDPSLFLPIKNGKNGDAYERENRASKWKKVDDWEPQED
jgi:uncharacterized protein YegJ (DUF2314 family)